MSIAMARNSDTGELDVYSLYDEKLLFSGVVKDNALAHKILNAIRDGETASYNSTVERMESRINVLFDRFHDDGRAMLLK